jgi:hypothetical protein
LLREGTRGVVDHGIELLCRGNIDDKQQSHGSENQFLDHSRFSKNARRSALLPGILSGLQNVISEAGGSAVRGCAGWTAPQSARR